MSLGVAIQAQTETQGAAAMSPVPITPATAAAFAARPLRITLRASPGGGTDIWARMLAGKLQQSLNQPVLVEIRASASSTIAAT